MSTFWVILIREIKNRLKLKRLIVALALQGALLFLILVLILAAELGNFARIFFLAETGLILLVAPLMTSNVVNTEIRKSNSEPLLNSSLQSFKIILVKLASLEIYDFIFLILRFIVSSLQSFKILLVKLVSLEVYNFIFLILCFIVSIIFIGFKNYLPLLSIIKIHLILLIYLYACGALGIFCSTICRNFLYASEMSSAILILLISNVVLIRPFVRWGFKASHTISLALHTNPFTPICAILELDIFRTQSGINLYNLSPIASYGYTFPAWYLIGLWYILVLVICLAISSVFTPFKAP